MNSYLSNVEVAKRMQEYLEKKKKLAKEDPEKAKKESIETLRKMGLIK